MNTGLVLDIGSGPKPFYSADVLLELKNSTDDQRWGRSLKVDRPTIIYDGNVFPFKERAFSYSVCKHVLEHVSNPAFFLDEISRISKSGYIETPSEIYELIFAPYDGHKWIISIDKNELSLREKLQENTSKFGGIFDHLVDRPQYQLGDHLFQEHRNLFLVEYFWKDKIEYNVIPANGSLSISIDGEQKIWELCRKNKIENVIVENIRNKASALRRVFAKIDMESLLMCPYCNLSVKNKEHFYLCTHCNAQFKKKGKYVIDMTKGN
jgi:SAM-dependent methyltransferase